MNDTVACRVELIIKLAIVLKEKEKSVHKEYSEER